MLKRICFRLCASVVSTLLSSPLVLIAFQPCWGQTSEAQLEGLYQQAQECLGRGEYEKALSYGERILSAARQARNPNQEASALDILGNVYYYTDRDVEALESFQARLTIMRELGDRLGEATALKDIGITLERFGRFDEAFEVIQESLNIFRELNHSLGIGSALENLGMGYASLGAYNLALEMYQEALAVARESGNVQLTFGALTRMGDLYVDLNKPERALASLRPALALAEQHNLSPIDRSWLMQAMSNALSDLGQADAALEMLQRSLTLCRRIGWKMGMGLTLLGLGHQYLDRDPTLALEYFQASLVLLERVDTRLLRRAYTSLARAYRRQGDLDRAIEYYEKAVEELESLRGGLASEDLRATFLGKHQRVYQELMQTLFERHQRKPGSGDDVRAFAVYEHGKARALLEAVVDARLDIDRDLEPDLRQRQDWLNASIVQLHKNLMAPGVTAEERRQMLERLTQAERGFRQLIVEVKRRNPRYAMLRYPRPLSVNQAQTLLGKSEAILAYAIAEDDVFAFLITARTFRAERLPVSPEVTTARVQSYVDLIAQGDRAGWQDASLRLHAGLLAPLLKHLSPEIKRLIIVPDGVLHYLPFETLTREAGLDDQSKQASEGANYSSPRYLLEDFSVSYTPSATVLAELNASQEALPVASADLLVLADPTIAVDRQAHSAPHRAVDLAGALYDDEGLEVRPVPFSALEAQKVERYAWPRSEVYMGGEASEHRIKTSRLDKFRVIHFATHGLISQRRPDRSALVLASADGDGEDGFLQAREIYRLKLKGDLVVLSACGSAHGQILGGEGPQSLAQAFFYAGAQSVVASLWSINDERAAAFMEAFYRHLTNGQSKVEALRAAKLEVLRDSSTSAPRYWACFILIGEANHPVGLSGPSWWLRNGQRLLVSACLFVMMLVAVFFYSKRLLSRLQ